MNQQLVTFGKYKGKPIEALMGDPEYTNWLLGQDWFAAKYKNLHVVVINNFQTPADTPEHNSLQALFLDDDFCISFARLISPVHFEDAFHQTEFLPRFHAHDQLKIDYEIKGETIGKIQVRDRRFEQAGIDVSFRVAVEFLDCSTKKGYEHDWTRLEKPEWQDSNVYKIEIKPSVGDDYPSVLRQMKSLACNVLFVGSFNGIGVNRDQFVHLFKNERLHVVFLNDLRTANPIAN